MKKLKKEFFIRKTEKVAKDLLWKILVHKIENKTFSWIIVETEAYVGSHDLACHASKWKTNRTKVMFLEWWIWYVYMIYGMYFNLNIVTDIEDCPCAVLIRAIEPLEWIEDMKINRKTEKNLNLTSWPWKLTQALKIDKSLNYSSAISLDSNLYIEDRGVKIKPEQIIKTKRVWIDYAWEWKDKPLRFYIKDNKFVSRK